MTVSPTVLSAGDGGAGRECARCREYGFLDAPLASAAAADVAPAPPTCGRWARAIVLPSSVHPLLPPLASLVAAVEVERGERRRKST